MIVIGITGGVGSGKSRVTYFISEITGFPVFEADRVAHEVMEAGTACCAEIVRVFGEEILAEDGNIDRKKLGAVVFGDAEKIGRLNAIVHPAVYEATETFLARAAEDGVTAVLMEAALPAMHLYFFAFVFMTFQHSAQTTFKALGKKKRAIFFSLFRKVIIVVPLTILLPRLFGLGTNGVFMAEPISNVIGGMASFITMLLTVLPELKAMEQEDAAEPA